MNRNKKDKVIENDPGITDAMRRRRKASTLAFLDSEFYKIHFEPHIDEKIRKYNKMTCIDGRTDVTIARTYKQGVNKVTIFRGLKNTFQDWIK